jgi:uncharacterized membrane protein
MKRLAKIYLSNKYQLSIFVLLAAASLFSIALVKMRFSYTDVLKYNYLIKNLFLAWIPFGVAYFIYMISLARKALYITLPIGAFLWLIFFPNAPYILTDIQNLPRDTGAAPIWYDVIMLVWFAWTGLFLGIISLFLMQEVVHKEFGRFTSWLFVIIVSGLSSAGIYMGRFLRWNSWDILQNPTDIAITAFEYSQDPSPRSIGFTFLFTAFFLFSYLTLYTFGNLLLEKRAKQVNDLIK